MRKDLLRSLFVFPRHERRGVLVLLSLMAVTWMLPFLSKRRTGQVAGIEWQRLHLNDSQTNRSSSQAKRHNTEKAAHNTQRWSECRFRPPAKVSPFDPNTATEAEWLRLGLTARQAGTILKYVSKGGRFKRVEDLKRIYGFPEEAFEVLSPYVRIATSAHAFDRDSYAKAGHKATGREIRRLLPLSVGINSADSATWESLPGIGPFLASRIVRFRKRLGGFHSITQVGETFGLPDSVYRRVLPLLVEEPESLSAGLDINALDLEELKSHPYLTHRLAQSIVAYREQHGYYRKPEDLLAIETLTPELFEKLRPYVRIR